MDSILRGAATYAFVWLIFRISGKRSLAQITTFDFVLLLIVSESTEAALINGDHSVTNSFLLVLTLIGIDIGLSLLKRGRKRVEKVIDSVPAVIVENGQPLEERMMKFRVDIGDILAAARQLHGLRRLDEIEYAVLERSGGISIIPKPGHG